MMFQNTSEYMYIHKYIFMHTKTSECFFVYNLSTAACGLGFCGFLLFLDSCQFLLFVIQLVHTHVCVLCGFPSAHTHRVCVCVFPLWLRPPVFVICGAADANIRYIVFVYGLLICMCLSINSSSTCRGLGVNQIAFYERFQDGRRQQAWSSLFLFMFHQPPFAASSL